MRSYEVSAAARLDLLQIWNYLAERSSLDLATRIVRDIQRAIEAVARKPSLGHPRSDLTTRPVMFYRVHSWLIIYVRNRSPLYVLRVLHSARDIKRILADET